jgi:hypothetical protein
LNRTPPLAHAVRSAVVILAVLTATAPVWAQTTDSGIQPIDGRTIPIASLAIDAPTLTMWDGAARREQLEKWIADYSAWREWAAVWGNRREPGWFSNSRSRRTRPDPPAWLFQECEGLAADAREEACLLLAEWIGGPAATTLNAAAPTPKAAEDDKKITWWEHVHLDAGWPALQSGTGVYGVLGLHATTTVRGRFQVFVAPGAMLLNVPTDDGRRAWRLATNYGIAYRLGQFTIPGTDREALLHLNLAKAWLLSAGPHVSTRSTDFVGLSMTFKKN